LEARILPEADSRRLEECPEMLDALQIAGIMPVEIAVFGAID
jgi:hypothetical protein